MKQLHILFLLCVSLLSCDILRDGFFEVKNWSPGDGFHNFALVDTITLDFTLEPDKNSVERSFSLSENGQNLAGHFTWQGRQMIFTPSSPLVANKDYTVTLKTDAQDERGLSLERQFEKVFTTRDGGTRPYLIATMPEEGGIIEEKRGIVTLLFSNQLLRNSLQNLSFSPSISGVWALNENGTEAFFTPSEDWVNGRAYRLVISSSLLSIKELEAGRSNTFHFSIGMDREPPELLSASALNTLGDDVLTLTAIETGDSVVENTGWEKDYRICFVFSESVDSTSVFSAFSCEPSLGFVQETPPGYYDTVVFRFSDRPVYGELYTFSLRKTVRDSSGNTMEKNVHWHIRADGEHSKPPVLRGMRFPKTPGLSENLICFSPDIIFSDFPIDQQYYVQDTGVETWLELYFETAAGASIDLMSLMDRFKCTSTNGALTFSPRLIRDESFTVQEPASGWETYYRVEIRGVLTNHPYMGLVTFEIGSGLKDNAGNKSADAMRILLIK